MIRILLYFKPENNYTSYLNQNNQDINSQLYDAISTIHKKKYTKTATTNKWGGDGGGHIKPTWSTDD